MGGCPCCGPSVAEWLECAVAVRGVLGIESRPRQTQKTFGDIGDLLTFPQGCQMATVPYTQYTGYKAKNNTTTLLTNPLHVGTGSRSVPTRYRSLISSRTTYSVICCMPEKKVSSYKLHMTPSRI